MAFSKTIGGLDLLSGNVAPTDLFEIERPAPNASYKVPASSLRITISQISDAGATGAALLAAANGPDARTALGLAIGTDVQAWDAGLDSISGLTTAADQLIYTTAADTYAVSAITAAGRALVNVPSALATHIIPRIDAIGAPVASALSDNGTTVSSSRPFSAASLASTGLTAGRIPFVTTGGLLTDSSLFSWSGATLLANSVAAAAGFDLRSNAGFAASFQLRSGSTLRWLFQKTSTAESGSDAGSNFALTAFNDAGSTIDSPVVVTRVAGGAIALGRKTIITGTAPAVAPAPGTAEHGGGASWQTGPGTFGGVVTVPNGTAAAPGLRITGEASGLYRFGADSLGITCAGFAAVRVAREAALTLGECFLSGTTESAGKIFGYAVSRQDAVTALIGGAGYGSGGQVRCYGPSHATKADHVEITKAAVARARFNGDGVFEHLATAAPGTPSATAVNISNGIVAVGTEYRVAGTKVVGAQGAAVADAAAGAGTATTAGWGFVSEAEFNAFVTAFNSMKDQLNTALARLRAHGLIAAA